MGEKQFLHFYFFSLAVSGVGISGSDRIFIEFARRWSKDSNIRIYTSDEGRSLLHKQKVDFNKVKVICINNKKYLFNFIFNYIYKVFSSVKLGFTIKIPKNKVDNIYLYSSSEFWMDSLAAFMLKLRYPKAIWVAAWYQTAPNPFKGYAEGEREKRYNFSAFLYWFVQLPIKPIIADFADFVLVNNEVEKSQFTRLNRKGRTIVVIGAIDLVKIKNWKLKNKNLTKSYDAVFQGRFHPQKGVVELIKIWRKVVDKKPDAKLVMIGDGPLMPDVRSKIENLKLGRNVKLLGYVFDGDEKYRTFAQSKIVVHPALFDSGGMASAEAMAFGLPVVGFNLKAYESYYPQGMVKVKIGDIDGFSKAILNLLRNKRDRSRVAKEALSMLGKNWSWEERAKETLDRILN